MENYFAALNSVNVNDKTERKNGLTYLSWAWAWGEIKKLHPDSTYTIYENGEGWNYHTDGKTAWVKTGVTVNGIEHIEYLPVMDYRNQSLPLDKVTSFDVNKTIQRSLTKAAARHGLGLYIYAGEDLPETTEAKAPETKKTAPSTSSEQGFKCADCGAPIVEYPDPKGEIVTVGRHATYTIRRFGRCLCVDCGKRVIAEQSA